MKKTNCLITGATGFIGSNLLDTLRLNRTYQPIAAIRTSTTSPAIPETSHRTSFYVPDISSDTDWSAALNEVSSIVHLAARAHVFSEKTKNPIHEYRRVNVDGTLNLARQAAKAGVRRFVFISSIGVNGNQSISPFTENDIPNPTTPYAIAKWEAEIGLRQISKDTGMELVIIRPPLVYGPNAPGNWNQLIYWVKKEIPLPFGAIQNKRSFIAIDNLIDLIITCLDHPNAINQTFLAGDGEDISTPELLRHIGLRLNKPVRLIPIPLVILQWMAIILRKRSMIQKICGSLQVDISKAREKLQWSPPLNIKKGLDSALL